MPELSEKVLLSQPEQGPEISLMSFSFCHSVPLDADIVVDARFLNDPHDDLALRNKTGLDEDVGAYIKEDNGFEGFLTKFKNQIKRQFLRCSQEGKSNLKVAVGCAGGQHRSVFTVETLRKWTEEQGVHVRAKHRDMPK